MTITDYRNFDLLLARAGERQATHQAMHTRGI